MIAEQLQYLPKSEAQRLLSQAEVVGRSLSGLINALGTKAA
jgi:hypothetical protein